jgi:sporulation protein YlmC with PRC-barrel domain
MIRKLLATTALVTFAAGGAFAAEQTSDRFLTSTDDVSMASQIIGETVYTSSAKDAESVGEIDDLLVGSDGKIDAALVGVGGFLGLGEKEVAISYDQLKLTNDEDGTYYVVLETSKEELEAAPAFEHPAETSAQKASRDATAPDGQEKARMSENAGDGMATKGDEKARMAAKDASGKPMATDKQAMADQKAVDAKRDTAMTGKTAAPMSEQPAANRDAAMSGREKYAIVDVTTMGTDELIGSNVYSYDNEDVGEIGEIVLTDEGKTDAVVIDVGGFLGLGEKPVAVAFEDLEFRADESGRLYVYTQFTEDQLKAATEYNEDEYKESRDQMRVRSAG